MEILSIRVRSIKSTNRVQFHIPLVTLKRNAMTHGMTYCNVMFVYSCVDEKKCLQNQNRAGYASKTDFYFLPVVVILYILAKLLTSLKEHRGL